jgi:hypothetical protein
LIPFNIKYRYLFEYIEVTGVTVDYNYERLLQLLEGDRERLESEDISFANVLKLLEGAQIVQLKEYLVVNNQLEAAEESTNIYSEALHPNIRNTDISVNQPARTRIQLFREAILGFLWKHKMTVLVIGLTVFSAQNWETVRQQRKIIEEQRKIIEEKDQTQQQRLIENQKNRQNKDETNSKN